MFLDPAAHCRVEEHIGGRVVQLLAGGSGMLSLLTVIGGLFVIVSGRNDGATIVSEAIEGSRLRLAGPLLLLTSMVVLIPSLGAIRVALSLETLNGGMSFSPRLSLAVLLTTTAVVLASNAVRVPTSITLALVGAVAGVGMTSGGVTDAALLGRVVTVSMLSPAVAAGLAFAFSRMLSRLAVSLRNRVWLSASRTATLLLLSLAYALNDGQKILFATALAANKSVSSTAGELGWMVAGGLLFAIGTIAGMRSRGRFVRHEVTTVNGMNLLSTELGAAGSVILGSLVGVPLSMTQSITGGLVGVALSKSRKAIRWLGVLRVISSWFWTLPASVALGYVVGIIVAV